MQAAAALHLPREADEASQDVRWMNAAAALLLGVAVCGLLWAGMQRLSRLPLFALQQVQLEGDLVRNNIATVRANIVPRLPGGFFQTDLARAREVFEAVPWVRHAVVRRVWPNELRVQLEEHRPAAYWQHEDRDDQLVNTFGEVFDANIGDVEERLPTLDAPANAGPGESRAMLDMLRRLQPVLAPLGNIDTLHLSERGSWSVDLDNDADIQLGRGSEDEIVARAQRFVRTLPELKRRYPAPLSYADLRYPEGYAVKLRGTTTSQEVVKPGAVRKPLPPANNKTPASPSRSVNSTR
ncbi:cell division protein FtsQ/DivIB [Aquabacterium sp.]|jgi:cell division protein FtsQ|uniref:cell division protein FtsQ/DivIB n=1 Tax=Aquabacterium sp. TaxID=1872578 RepID=UPI00248854F0|nr:cell division protein FtsQ/DivIB [Aquabacterium sp.]MDI1350228.1 cell division protein FtsQ/DivIB [Aquabacterium sp.]